MNTQVRVLIDNCILSHSEILEGAKLTKYSGKNKSEWLGYVLKTLPFETDPWLAKQIEHLPTIASMASNNKLELFSYPELRNESWHRSRINPIGYISANIEIKEVDSAIERSYFQQSDLALHISKQRIIDFYKSLLKLDPSDIVPKHPFYNRLPKPMLTNLKSIQRFKDICKGLSDNQLLDAFHLWSAEVNKMDYFLTVDRKFIRAMTQSKRIDLPCLPISPEHLTEELQITALVPFQYKEGQFIDYFGAIHELEPSKHSSKLSELKKKVVSLFSNKI